MTAEARNSVIFGVLLLGLGGICVGYAPIGLRLSVDSGMGPQGTAFWRFLFSVPMIFLVLKSTGRRIGRPNKFAILAGLFFALDVGLWHWGLTETSVANATFIVNLGNIGVGLLAWFFLKERPTWVWGLAATIAMIGAGCLSYGGAGNAASSLRGDMLSLGAAVMVSGYMLFAKIARTKSDALAVLFWATVTEAVVAMILTLISGEPFFPVSWIALGWILSISLVASLAGQGFIIAGVGKAPAAIAGIMMLLQPITAALISWPLFGEFLAPVQLVGAMLILAGMALAQVRFSAKRSPVV